MAYLIAKHLYNRHLPSVGLSVWHSSVAVELVDFFYNFVVTGSERAGRGWAADWGGAGPGQGAGQPDQKPPKTAQGINNTATKSTQDTYFFSFDIRNLILWLPINLLLSFFCAPSHLYTCITIVFRSTCFPWKQNRKRYKVCKIIEPM